MSVIASISTRRAQGELTVTTRTATREGSELLVSQFEQTHRFAIPTRPVNAHENFWRLDFQSPARSGYATVLI